LVQFLQGRRCVCHPAARGNAYHQITRVHRGKMLAKGFTRLREDRWVRHHFDQLLMGLVCGAATGTIAAKPDFARRDDRFGQSIQIARIDAFKGPCDVLEFFLHAGRELAFY
jgi:hypothetical protein